MKKLSDYRITEDRGDIIIEKETDMYVWIFKKREKKFLPVDFKGKCCLDMDFSNKIGEYPSIEAAKAQIIKWCDEPKYHYVVEDNRLFSCPNFALGKKRYKVQSVPLMDIPWSVGMSAICRELPSWAAVVEKEQLSRADIEYLEKRKAEKERTENAVLLADLENILFVMMDKDDVLKSFGLTKKELFDELKQKRCAEKKPNK